MRWQRTIMGGLAENPDFWQQRASVWDENVGKFLLALEMAAL